MKLVIPVTPVPNAAFVGILGAATNGNTSGTAYLNYADGSSSFALGLTDWGSNVPAFGNLIAAQFTTINTQSGTRSGTYSLSVAEFPLQSGRTLQSVTLPTSVSGGQLHVFAVGTRAALNNLGTSNNNQPGEGNYDGQGKSWSIQALEAAGIQQGQPFLFNGVNFTWPASYGGLADNDVAGGQTIPVTLVPNATTLGFLGSGTFGSPGGLATITYTNHSPTTFTLGMTDWWSNSVQYNDLVAATFSTINVPGGTQSGSFYLYYMETRVPTGATIQSVTLPTTISQGSGQLHVFAVGTRSDYNNIGISDDSNPSSANFDGNGNSYSAQDFTDAGWNPGDTLTYEGINYIWPNVPSGADDNYQANANSQMIPVSAPAGATTIGLVGAASNALPSASGTVTFTYSSGTPTQFPLSFADWSLTGNPPASNRLFALLPDYNTSYGTQASPHFLFEVETPLDATRQLIGVTLPTSVNGGQLHVFMMGTRTGEHYPNNVGTSDDWNTIFANLDTTGRSYSIEALEAATPMGLYEGQPFTFNGVTFTWPASYAVIPDNYQTTAQPGQIVPVIPVNGATTLAFVGAATNTGPGEVETGTATITYTNGDTQNFPLTLVNWWSQTPPNGSNNQIVTTCAYINTAAGQQTQAVTVYYTDVALQANKTIQSVTLPSTVSPSSGQLHVFAVGTK